MSLKKLRCFPQQRRKLSHFSASTSPYEECRKSVSTAASTTKLRLGMPFDGATNGSKKIGVTHAVTSMTGRREMLAALLWIGIFCVPAIAQTLQESTAAKSEIAISVHDYADVPPSRLAAAETEARRIFRLAGINTVWISCSAKLEKTESPNCSSVDASHLVLKLVGNTSRVANRDEVLGSALLADDGSGYYAYAFLDHIQMLEQDLGFPLLGYVLAHEIGHLLFGSNAHSVNGIMSPHWSGTELRKISEGSLLFLPNESRTLRRRLKHTK